MQLTSMWLLCLLAVVLPWRMWRKKTLRIPRDYFLLLIYGQSFIHLHLAPTLFVQSPDLEGWGGRPGSELKWLYVLIQLAAILLFEWPLLHFYSKGIARASTGKSVRATGCVLKPRSINIVSVFSILFSISFLIVAVRNDILRLPHDTQTIVGLFVDLPTYVYVVHRLFIYAGLFLTCILLLILLRLRGTGNHLLVTMAFCLTAGAWLLNALLNHRLLVTLGVAALAGVFLVWNDRSEKVHENGKIFLRPKISLRMTLAGIIVIYTMVVANNIRFAYDYSGGLRLQHFNPLMSLTEYMPDDPDPIIDPRWRLNGADLMARITPAAIHDGYALGDAWLYYAIVSIGQWVSRSAVEEYKLNWASDPKVYLLWRYTDLEYIDWPNTFVTDLYGNLAFPGLLIGALVMARVLVRGTGAIACQTSGAALLVGIYLLTQSLDFEQGFSVWLFGLLRAAPILLFLVLFNPFVQQLGKASNASKKIASE